MFDRINCDDLLHAWHTPHIYYTNTQAPIPHHATHMCVSYIPYSDQVCILHAHTHTVQYAYHTTAYTHAVNTLLYAQMHMTASQQTALIFSRSIT